jgi:hypothetical protein
MQLNLLVYYGTWGSKTQALPVAVATDTFHTSFQTALFKGKRHAMQCWENKHANFVWKNIATGRVTGCGKWARFKKEKRKGKSSMLV